MLAVLDRWKSFHASLIDALATANVSGSTVREEVAEPVFLSEKIFRGLA